MSSSPFDVVRLESYADWTLFQREQSQLIAVRRALERRLGDPSSPGRIQGHCLLCDEPSTFSISHKWAYVQEGVLLPNWRESLHCQRCGLNNRMRAAIHLFQELCQPGSSAEIYLTEQATPFFQVFRGRFPGTVGSEYFGADTPPGAVDAGGVRNENLTALSFPDSSFDFVASFDVLEHVPDVQCALDECFRVLRPGGKLVFTAPFDLNRPGNLIRAMLEPDGTIKHLVTPEYHGDPLRADGCLAFYLFGWELLDQVRSAAFAGVHGLHFWSEESGHLGANLIAFVAEKPPN